MEFTGYIVSGDGIRVDTQKIEAVQSFPRPTFPTTIRSFLGLAACYRRFVEGLSYIVSFDQDDSEDSQFEWSKACEKSLKELNKRLTTALILNLPEGTQGFVGVL